MLPQRFAIRQQPDCGVFGVPQFDVIKAYGDAPDVCISDEHQAMCAKQWLSGAARAGVWCSDTRGTQAARACGGHGVCCGWAAAWHSRAPGAGSGRSALGLFAGAARRAAGDAQQIALDGGRGAESGKLALACFACSCHAGLLRAAGLGRSANQTAKQRKTLLNLSDVLISYASALILCCRSIDPRQATCAATSTATAATAAAPAAAPAV